MKEDQLLGIKRKMEARETVDDAIRVYCDSGVEDILEKAKSNHTNISNEVKQKISDELFNGPGRVSVRKRMRYNGKFFIFKDGPVTTIARSGIQKAYLTVEMLFIVSAKTPRGMMYFMQREMPGANNMDVIQSMRSHLFDRYAERCCGLRGNGMDRDKAIIKFAASMHDARGVAIFNNETDHVLDFIPGGQHSCFL